MDGANPNVHDLPDHQPSNVQDAFMNAKMPNGIGSRLDECPAAQKEADRLIVHCGKAGDRG